MSVRGGGGDKQRTRPEEIASSARARSVLQSMPRTVTSCHVLPLSAEDYLLIRGDPTYEAYKADLVHQDLHITKLRSGADERADPTRWRSVEVHFRENPVPPFLRSFHVLTIRTRIAD